MTSATHMTSPTDMTSATDMGSGSDMPSATERRTVLQGGRPKAYRPLPFAERRTAFLAGVAAYARGDFFEAHELLEPAWMGSDDPAERELHQGLIKLAAGYVHAVRGNADGVAKNLRGARERLATAFELGVPDIGTLRDGTPLDVATLVADIDACLARLGAQSLTSFADEPPRLRGLR
jgi:hypothetical protein